MTPYNSSEIDDIKSRKVCSSCVGDNYLSEEVLKFDIQAQCNYCEQEAKVINVDELSSEVENAIDTHFIRTPVDPDYFESCMHKEGHDWWRSGEPINEVISEIAIVSAEIAEDVRKLID